MIKICCDLCGKPIESSAKSSYKIRREWFGWPADHGWERIDVHDECVRVLFDAVHNKKEFEDDK